jgi:hypothetical protein
MWRLASDATRASLGSTPAEFEKEDSVRRLKALRGKQDSFAQFLANLHGHGSIFIKLALV